MKMAAFWVVAPCSLVPDCRAQQPRRQPSLRIFHFTLSLQCVALDHGRQSRGCPGAQAPTDRFQGVLIFASTSLTFSLTFKQLSHNCFYLTYVGTHLGLERFLVEI
jgi:hypothetical protein